MSNWRKWESSFVVRKKLFSAKIVEGDQLLTELHRYTNRFSGVGCSHSQLLVLKLAEFQKITKILVFAPDIRNDHNFEKPKLSIALSYFTIKCVGLPNSLKSCLFASSFAQKIVFAIKNIVSLF